MVGKYREGIFQFGRDRKFYNNQDVEKKENF